MSTKHSSKKRGVAGVTGGDEVEESVFERGRKDSKKEKTRGEDNLH